MADLGTLTTVRQPARTYHVIAFDWLAGAVTVITRPVLYALRRMPMLFEAPNITSTSAAMSSPMTSSVSGTVLLNAVPVANCVVRLYHRDSGLLVDRTLTDSVGAYNFTNLYGATDGYFAIAFDPAGGGQYDAVVHDFITPA